MTNDTSTLNGALTELGETMADNLVAMGVTGATASMGLTTLSSKILDIAPSVGGITPVVTIDISKTPSGTIYEGDTVIIECKVNADYDDESVVDIDLHGYLQGATLTIKNNGTTLGTAVSDSTGVATYTISNIQTGNYSITAHFDGTGTDYESATSSALTFTVDAVPYDGITVTSNKNILSYYNTDTATLSAQLTINGVPSSISGVTITFKQGSTTLGTAVTDNTGLATLNNAYTSTGIGDISCTATDGTITSNSITIEDCYYYNDGSSVNGLEIDSAVSCSSNGTYITITKNSNGEQYVYLPHTLTNSDDWLYEVEIADTGQVNPIALIFDNSRKWGNYTISNNQWSIDFGAEDTTSGSYNVGDIVTITREDGVDTALLNHTTQLSQRTATHYSTFKVGFYTNQNRVQNIKNIKLKAL